MTTHVIQTLRGDSSFLQHYEKAKKIRQLLFKQFADQFGVILYQHSIWQASKEV